MWLLSYFTSKKNLAFVGKTNITVALAFSLRSESTGACRNQLPTMSCKEYVRTWYITLLPEAVLVDTTTLRLFMMELIAEA